MSLFELQATPLGEWAERAACLGMDHRIFFPSTGQQPKLAYKICDGCDVQFECYRFAVATEQPAGVWGGVTILQKGSVRRRHVKV